MQTPFILISHKIRREKNGKNLKQNNCHSDFSASRNVNRCSYVQRFASCRCAFSTVDNPELHLHHGFPNQSRRRTTGATHFLGKYLSANSSRCSRRQMEILP